MRTSTRPRQLSASLPQPVHRVRVLQVGADQLDPLRRDRGGRTLGAGTVAAVMRDQVGAGRTERERDLGADALRCTRQQYGLARQIHHRPTLARSLAFDRNVYSSRIHACPTVSAKNSKDQGERHGDAGARRPSLDGKLPARAEAADAGRDRRRFDRAVVRADPAGSSPARAARPAARHQVGIGAAPPSDRHAVQERERGHPSHFPRRRLLAASRAGGGGRDRRAHRVPDPGLGLGAIGLRAQPGLVRVCEPARRAAQHGGGRASRSIPGAAPSATPCAWRRASPAGARS